VLVALCNMLDGNVFDGSVDPTTMECLEAGMTVNLTIGIVESLYTNYCGSCPGVTVPVEPALTTEQDFVNYFVSQGATSSAGP